MAAHSRCQWHGPERHVSWYGWSILPGRRALLVGRRLNIHAVDPIADLAVLVTPAAGWSAEHARCKPTARPAAVSASLPIPADHERRQHRQSRFGSTVVMFNRQPPTNSARLPGRNHPPHTTTRAVRSVH